MRLRRTLLLLLVALILTAGCEAHACVKPATRDRVPGLYVVTVKPGAGKASVRKAFGARVVQRVADLGHHEYMVRIRHDPGPKAVMRGVLGAPGIRAVQPDYTYHAEHESGPAHSTTREGK